MAHHAHVPKFGNWESGEQVPYTQYFEVARQGRNAGRMINPNDPQENLETYFEDAPSVEASVKTNPDPEIPKQKHRRHFSKEDGEFHRTTDSPARHDVTRKPYSDSPNHRRVRRPSAGSDRSIEQSPLHPHYQVKMNKGGVSSPSWERRVSAEGHVFTPQTPGRSRMRHDTQSDDMDKSSAVPKFGEWDEGDPASADGYTHIFNKVREEKQVGSARVPIIRNESTYADGQKRNSTPKSMGCSCFGWLK